MRFCHVSTFYPPYHFGGDAILTQSICEGLLRRGHEVTIVHAADAYELRGPRITAPVVDPPGLRRVTVRSAFGALAPLLVQQTGRPALLHKQLEAALSNEFDVVHFHNISLIGGPGVLSLSRAPVTLYTTHDHWLFCTTHVLWKNNERPCDVPKCLRCALASRTPPQLWRHGDHVARSLQQVDAILAPSQFTADRHRAAGITTPTRLLPSFTHFTGADSGLRRANGPFVYAGRLVRSKGIEQVLEAFRDRPALELMVVGDGPLSDTLRAQYAKHPNISFVGPLPHAEMQALYGRATAVVIPSWGPEVFPLTALEAMICGAPVIVRRAGGSAEAVERTGGGLVYNEPDELLPLLDRVASDHQLRCELGERAREGTAAEYLEDTWMDRYFAIIEQIAGTKRALR